VRAGVPRARPRKYVKPVRTLGNNGILALRKALSWSVHTGLCAYPFRGKAKPADRIGVLVFFFCQGRTELNYVEDFRPRAGSR
jgi:hypothetical protein